MTQAANPAIAISSYSHPLFRLHEQKENPAEAGLGPVVN